LQRLPPHRIQRANELSEIGLEEHPAASGLGSRDEAAPGARPDFLGVHVEKDRGFVEIDSLHATVSFEANLTPDRSSARLLKKSVKVCAEFRLKP
jgi:hypothetical protein